MLCWGSHPPSILKDRAKNWKTNKEKKEPTDLDENAKAPIQVTTAAHDVNFFNQLLDIMDQNVQWRNITFLLSSEGNVVFFVGKDGYNI